jgi:hypothetical protein
MRAELQIAHRDSSTQSIRPIGTATA